MCFNFDKKNTAFTLAEVLITLSILGVVAAISIPSINKRNMEKITVLKVRKAFAAISNAYEIAKVENGSILHWAYGGNKINISDNIYRYLNVWDSNKCSVKYDTNHLDDTTYKNLTGGASNFNVLNNFPCKKFKDGTSVIIVNSGFSIGKTECENNGWCGLIFVDTNGADKPNRMGVDVFKIEIYKDKLVAGEISSKNCQYNETHKENGLACTNWIIRKGNMAYLHHNISAEW